MLSNLNDSTIDNDGPGVTIIDPAVSSGNISVYFRDAMTHLIKKIDDAEYVIGCAAWMTHPGILKAFQKKLGVSVVVAKEDWLRPDSTQYSSIREMYDGIKPLGGWLNDLPFLDNDTYMCVSSMTWATRVYDGAVRCFGNFNIAKSVAWPRLHHKFLVFLKKETKIVTTLDGDESCTYLAPYAVWTGSLNLTHNSENSLENGVYIVDAEIATAYTKEFTQIYAMSEPLNWQHIYTTPEHRIGT